MCEVEIFCTMATGSSKNQHPDKRFQPHTCPLYMLVFRRASCHGILHFKGLMQVVSREVAMHRLVDVVGTNSLIVHASTCKQCKGYTGSYNKLILSVPWSQSTRPAS